jgi:Cu2+-exporting ATPase
MLSPSMLFDEQSQVFSASVNLATETAIVRPVTEAKIVPNWQKQLGEALAKHLTSCGFISNLRGKPSHHHHCCCCDYTPPSS